MLKKSLLLLPLIAALSIATPALAANYHIVVPAPGKGAPYAAIQMELSPASLPEGRVGMPYAGFDFNTALQITGDSALDMSQVTWSAWSGALPQGLTLTKEGSVVGVPTETDISSFQVLARYKTKSAVGTYAVEVTAERHLVEQAGVRSWEDGTYAQSCLEYRQPTKPYSYSGATGDGMYRIAPNGQAPFDAYCDMTSEGGGWTRVALQYETSPVGWAGVVNGGSYSLTQNQIPAHTHTGFGKDDQATYVDYVTFLYPIGDIPVTRVKSPKTGKEYQIFRSSNSVYSWHDPEGTLTAGAVEAGVHNWGSTLTFDEFGKLPALTWSFVPFVSTVAMRGYALGGKLFDTRQSFGWSVWVR